MSLLDDLRKRRRAAKAAIKRLTASGGFKKIVARLRARVKSLTKRIKHLTQPPPPSVMFDAVAVAAIPTDAKAVGCYVGPSVFTCDAVAKRCLKARRVKISQAGMSKTPADVVDIETGDATIGTGTQWLKRKLAGEPMGGEAGKVPKVYTSASTLKAFIAYAAAHGVPRSKYRIWSAHYGSGEHICGPDTCGFPQADATQWTDKALGRDLDQSKLKSSFWD